jgi:hypothetical protein
VGMKTRCGSRTLAITATSRVNKTQNRPARRHGSVSAETLLLNASFEELRQRPAAGKRKRLVQTGAKPAVVSAKDVESTTDELSKLLEGA